MIKFIALGILLASNAALARNINGIVIKDAWVREAPPIAKVMAAYLIIENQTDKQTVLTKISSPTFNRVEIHKNITRNGMATMERQQKLLIPAKGSINMQAQGYHLMLFNPVVKLKAGDTVRFSLKFAGGAAKVVTAKVKRATGGMHHQQMDMDHMDMNHEHMNK